MHGCSKNKRRATIGGICMLVREFSTLLSHPGVQVSQSRCQDDFVQLLANALGPVEGAYLPRRQNRPVCRPRTACHASLPACQRRAPDQTRGGVSLESSDQSRSGRAPSACTYLFGEKGSALWNRHTWKRRIGQILHQHLQHGHTRVSNCR